MEPGESKDSDEQLTSATPWSLRALHEAELGVAAHHRQFHDKFVSTADGGRPEGPHNMWCSEGVLLGARGRAWLRLQL